MLDKIIVNGLYPDFNEKKMKNANIGIKDGKIAFIGSEQPEAAEIIELPQGRQEIRNRENDDGNGRYDSRGRKLRRYVSATVGI